MTDQNQQARNMMGSMANEVAHINNAVQEVNAISQKNKESIENLSKEVGKFKV